MTAWSSDELNKIGKAEELQITSLRGDNTLRSWVIIWMVRVGDDIYTRLSTGVPLFGFAVCKRVMKDESPQVVL